MDTEYKLESLPKEIIDSQMKIIASKLEVLDSIVVLSYNIDGDHIKKENINNIIDGVVKKINHKDYALKKIFLISIQEDMSPSIFEKDKHSKSDNETLKGLKDIKELLKENFDVYIDNFGSLSTLPSLSETLPNKSFLSKVYASVSKSTQPPRSITSIVITRKSGPTQTTNNIFVKPFMSEPLYTSGKFIIYNIVYKKVNVFFINVLFSSEIIYNIEKNLSHVLKHIKNIEEEETYKLQNNLYILAGDLKFKVGKDAPELDEISDFLIASRDSKRVTFLVDDMNYYISKTRFFNKSFFYKYVIKDYILTDNHVSRTSSREFKNVKDKVPSYSDRILLIIPIMNQYGPYIHKTVSDALDKKYKQKFKTIENIGTESDHLGVEFYDKYLKYKNKYINLKKSLD